MQTGVRIDYKTLRKTSPETARQVESSMDTSLAMTVSKSISGQQEIVYAQQFLIMPVPVWREGLLRHLYLFVPWVCVLPHYASQ